MTPLDIAPEFTSESLQEVLRAATARTGEVHRFESTHRRKDGSHYPAEIHLQLVGTDRGDVLLALVNDITERRWAEEEILMLNADLERRVTEPREEAIKGVADVRFVVSSSRENGSNILVRFRDISERVFDKRVNDLRRKKIKEETDNLNAKKAIMDELKGLIAGEENIGNAFQRFSELQEKWKTIGPVPQQTYRDLQNDYSHLRDEFFYHIRIYKELRDHDLRKNTALKQALISDVESLSQKDSIKELEHGVKEYQEKWHQVGPVVKEEWEALRDRFSTATRVIYDKIHEHYKARRSEHETNLQAKQALLEKVTTLIVDKTGTLTHNEMTVRELLAGGVQYRVTGSGYAPQGEFFEIGSDSEQPVKLTDEDARVMRILVGQLERLPAIRLHLRAFILRSVARTRASGFDAACQPPADRHPVLKQHTGLTRPRERHDPVFT